MVANKSSHLASEEELSSSAVSTSVSTEPLDRFCERQNIDRIDLLKIDTEGHDLSVLQGARKMLADRKIGCVFTEVGLNPANDYHVSFDVMKAWLEGRGYYLFGLYDQAHEFDGESYLRRMNAAFIECHHRYD